MAMRLAPSDVRQIQMASDEELADLVRTSTGNKYDEALMERDRRALRSAQEQRMADERARLADLRDASRQPRTPLSPLDEELRLANVPIHGPERDRLIAFIA